MRKEYPVTLLCKTIGVSTSGYYAYLKRPKKELTDRDKKDIKAIKKLYKKSKGTYGAKRIAGELRSNNHIINHKRVDRLMKELNIKSKIRQVKTKKEEKVNSAGFVYNNLLNRDFDAAFPNKKWVTDITELNVMNNKMYISALMDLFNREIISFVISDSPNIELISDTIHQAMRKRNLKDLKDVIIHSDQGSVYRSYDHKKLSNKLKFTPSMSRKANCWDNAVIESFFSHLKTEFVCHYSIESLEQVKNDLTKFVEYFNNERSQKRLGYLNPTSYFETHFLAV
nr:IS3 family transposase [Paenibacillus bovis]